MRPSPALAVVLLLLLLVVLLGFVPIPFAFGPIG